MPFHIQYGRQALTCLWRADGTLAVRLRRLQHRNEGLLLRLGDTLLIHDERGRERWACTVAAFAPRLQYGTFVRSGIVTCAGICALYKHNAGRTGKQPVPYG